jgi:hypothetical protein
VAPANPDIYRMFLRRRCAPIGSSHRLDANWWGFDVRENLSLVSHGMPDKPVIYSDVQFVQEQSVTPCIAFILPDFEGNSDQIGPVMDFRFCDFYAAADWYHVWAGNRKTGD